MAEDDERRRHPRLRLDGRMVGRATVLTEFRVATLSETGATLEMAIPLAMGSSCDLTLNLSNVAVDLKARVIEVRSPERSESPYVIGVDFASVDALDLGLLQSFLERERRREL
jgi:hypothetical protein